MGVVEEVCKLEGTPVCCAAGRAAGDAVDDRVGVDGARSRPEVQVKQAVAEMDVDHLV